MAPIYFFETAAKPLRALDPACHAGSWTSFVRSVAATLCLLILGCALHPLASANELPPGADLRSLHLWLRDHNPQLQAMQVEAEAADARILPAGALPDPMASITLGGIDPEHPAWLPGNAGSTSYQLRQRLPLWGKRALSRDIASAQAQALHLERQAAALELQARVEDAYVRYWHADASVRVVDRLLGLLEQIEEVAGVRYALGISAQQDSIRAQVESTSMKLERIARQAAQRESAATLNALLGRRVDAPLIPPATQPALPIKSTSLSQALASLDTDSHPALQAGNAAALAAARNAERVRRDRLPDLTVGIGSMQRGNRIESYELMLEVEIPFQQQARREREHESRLLAETAIARSQATRTALQDRLGTAWTRWTSAAEQRRLIEKALMPQADANFRSALASYQVGEVDFGTLLDALRQWQGADLARIDAARDELLGAAALRAIEGETP